MPAIIFALRIIIASPVRNQISGAPRHRRDVNATLATEPAPAGAEYDESKFVLSAEERAEFEDLRKAHTARVEALRACRAAPKPKPMASTPLEAEALALLEKQREGLSWSVSETDASGRPMPI